MARQQKQVIAETPTSTAPVKSLFERVAAYLDANDWNYTANAEKNYFTAACRIKDASVRVILDVTESEDWQRVLVYSCFPVFVPEQRRAAVAGAPSSKKSAREAHTISQTHLITSINVRKAVTKRSMLALTRR